ncbi:MULTISPECIES: DUF2000 family protein [Paraburkholderia]|uniref:DUF2000 family protein n=1 Tax=Paraburkholderia TaxID=1822464 RepID=UPI0024836BFD|nr:DUF2000 family protein [Paraburkholderia podalyriae]
MRSPRVRRSRETGLPSSTRDIARPITEQATNSLSCRGCANLDLVGLALYGPKKAVDKVVKGLALHE